MWEDTNCRKDVLQLLVIKAALKSRGGESDEAHIVSKTDVLNSLHSKTLAIVFFSVQSVLFVTVNSSKD